MAWIRDNADSSRWERAYLTRTGLVTPEGVAIAIGDILRNSHSTVTGLNLHPRVIQTIWSPEDGYSVVYSILTEKGRKDYETYLVSMRKRAYL